MQLHQIKEEICDIGRRIYAKGFAAGNDGNISYRLGENQVLCTPTMICKGFIKPADLCIVDMEGNQVAGQKKRTSEIRLHLAIMKARPEIKSVVHCHPPHATAFAVAREPIPQCVLPEVEVFLGDVPITKYETPGDQEFADTVLPFVHKANVIILANHGTVSLRRHGREGVLVDRDSRRVLPNSDARARPRPSDVLQRARKHASYWTSRAKWGYTDPRLAQGMENCDICANDIFRDSWQQSGVERQGV